MALPNIVSRHRLLVRVFSILWSGPPKLLSDGRKLARQRMVV